MKTPLALVLGLTTALAMAQPEWVRTGAVTATLGGETSTLHTFVAHVPDDLGEGIEDADARAFAERVAGSDQHTATLMHHEPITAGDAVLVPAVTFVLIGARGAGDPDAGSARLALEFGVDPDTRALHPDTDLTVEYHPAPFAPQAYYALSEGTLTLESLRPVGEDALAVTGTLRGTLRFEGSGVEGHAPGDTVPIEATFDIDHVAGRSPLPELLAP